MLVIRINANSETSYFRRGQDPTKKPNEADTINARGVRSALRDLRAWLKTNNVGPATAEVLQGDEVIRTASYGQGGARQGTGLFKKNIGQGKKIKRTGFTVLDRVITNQGRLVDKMKKRKERLADLIQKCDARILKAQAKVVVHQQRKEQRLALTNASAPQPAAKRGPGRPAKQNSDKELVGAR